jgi:hypothetical protein
MNYNIIVYELIIFKKELSTGRTIQKKYFQKIKTIKNVNIKDISKKIMELKQLYKDSKYIIDFIKDDSIDYFEKLNKKSYNDYIKYMKGGAIR